MLAEARALQDSAEREILSSPQGVYRLMSMQLPFSPQTLCRRSKENELYNTAKIAELNKCCLLSPSMEDESSLWTPTIVASGLDEKPGYLLNIRRVALQRWKRYRSGFTAACRETRPLFQKNHSASWISPSNCGAKSSHLSCVNFILYFNFHQTDRQLRHRGRSM